jgi:uncharacterized membrane protein
MLVQAAWDPFPFILLNLVFSTQAAYAAPLLLLSQNRRSDRDRVQAEHDFGVNQLALQQLFSWRSAAHRLVNRASNRSAADTEAERPSQAPRRPPDRSRPRAQPVGHPSRPDGRDRS